MAQMSFPPTTDELRQFKEMCGSCAVCGKRLARV
jgi:hypothetical protein